MPVNFGQTETTSQGGKHSAEPFATWGVDPKVLLQEAHILHEGAKKYGLFNWMKIPTTDHINHALIHIYKWLDGDTTEDHLGHARCRLGFAMSIQHRGNAPWLQESIHGTLPDGFDNALAESSPSDIAPSGSGVVGGWVPLPRASGGKSVSQSDHPPTEGSGGYYIAKRSWHCLPPHQQRLYKLEYTGPKAGYFKYVGEQPLGTPAGT